MRTAFIRFPSPLGELVLTASDTALTGVQFPTSRHGPPLHEVERRAGGEDDGHGPASALPARARRPASHARTAGAGGGADAAALGGENGTRAIVQPGPGRPSSGRGNGRVGHGRARAAPYVGGAPATAPPQRHRAPRRRAPPGAH